MRVAVTGAAGFVGAHVVRALLDRGDDVLVFLRPETSRQRLQPVLDDIRVVSTPLDDSAATRTALTDFRVEAALHLAWSTRSPDYLTSAANLDSLASTGSFALAAFASGAAKFVGVGTCLEYASLDRPRTEQDPTDPRTLYAACKVAAWLVVRALAAQHGAEVAWGRLFHVHGPMEDAARLVPAAAAALASGRPFDVSPGQQVRDHLHVADAAAALIHLSSPQCAGVYNVCSGIPVTLREVLTQVAAIMGRPELMRFGARPYSPDETMVLAGDPARLRGTGWTPRFTDLRTSLADGLSHVGGVSAR